MYTNVKAEKNYKRKMMMSSKPRTEYVNLHVQIYVNNVLQDKNIEQKHFKSKYKQEVLLLILH